MSVSLSHPFWPVGNACGMSQNWYASPRYRGYGCGTVAALMVLGYLAWHHPEGQSEPFQGFPAQPTKEQCVQLMDTVGQRYFPVIPRYGMNGLALAWWMNLYFFRFRMPYRAAWESRRSRLVTRMEEMLAADIPVIFSVGPDFPLLWQKHPLALYSGPGQRMPQASVRAHYMVATGVENGWIRLSSWGRQYALPVGDWLAHHKYHSGGLVDGILYIRKRKE